MIILCAPDFNASTLSGSVTNYFGKNRAKSLILFVAAPGASLLHHRRLCLIPICIKRFSSTTGGTVVKCGKASPRARVRLLIVSVIERLLTDSAGNQSLKACHTLILSYRSGGPFTTGVSALLCRRQTHINASCAFRFAAVSDRRKVFTNRAHVGSLKIRARLEARYPPCGDLSAIDQSRFVQSFEIVPCLRIVERGRLFEPSSCNADIPSHSSTIEIKHSQIVHGRCVAEIRCLLK